MKIAAKHTLFFICLILFTNLFSQTVDPIFGIWKASKDALPSNSYTNDVRGSLVRINWNDIEKNKNQWNTWSVLDNALKGNKDKPIVLLVWVWIAGKSEPGKDTYTGNILPGYITMSGTGDYLPPIQVYKYNPNPLLYKRFAEDLIDVPVCNDGGLCQTSNGWVPDYLAPPFGNTNFQDNVKRMINAVKARIIGVRNGTIILPQDIKDGYNKIIAVQACLGSTGDFPGYKGAVTQIDATTTDISTYFNSLSTEFDAAYQSTGIHVLHNPGNDPTLKLNWVIGAASTLHAPWIKMGDVGHAYQLNDERNYYNALVSNNYFLPPAVGKEYARSRSETSPDIFNKLWWFHPYTNSSTNPVYPGMRYRNMLAFLGSALHFGLDWSNQLQTELTNTTSGANYYKNAFDFYNRNAGQRDPLIATNAFCMLRDGLDASDVLRFPTPPYPIYDNNSTNLKNRFKAIAGKTSGYSTEFKDRGALLEDVANAVGSSGNNRDAEGINDVGDSIVTGNYERYLHLIKPAGVGSDIDSNNRTSLGWWNVYSSDSTSVYGRFARGISTVNGKNGLYFDIDDDFYNTAIDILPTPVIGINTFTPDITITYLDDGSSASWDLYYVPFGCLGNNGQYTGGGIETILDHVILNGTGGSIWKQKTYHITNGTFENNGLYNSDFSIRTTSSNIIKFSLVEISINKSSYLVGNCLGSSNNKSVENISNLNIYPNPTSDRFTVELNSKKLISKITVHNQYGVMVLNKKVNAFSYQISRFEIGNKPGLYFINVTTSDGGNFRAQVKVL